MICDFRWSSWKSFFFFKLIFYLFLCTSHLGSVASMFGSVCFVFSFTVLFDLLLLWDTMSSFTMHNWILAFREGLIDIIFLTPRRIHDSA
jgi:hypothetical protein